MIMIITSASPTIQQCFRQHAAIPDFSIPGQAATYPSRRLSSPVQTIHFPAIPSLYSLPHQVPALWHPLNITVEAELGHVADAIGGLTETRTASASDDDIERALTKPEDAKRFIELTGVDCLAVAIGTAHGVYVSTPTLRFELLKRINATSPAPLVLHGGSGTPDPDVQRAIDLGITKINIYSEVLAALNSGLKEKLNGLENLSAWPCVVYSVARERMREVIRHKIRTFGSNGRA